jgi:outer membrane protein assembly factor BamA
MTSRLAILLLLLIASCASGAERFVAREVRISGLHRTRAWVVERELQFAAGDSVTSADLMAARRRIQNLSLFSDVRLTGDSSGVISVDLAELWPLIPFLWMDFTEGQITDVLRRPDTFFDKVTLYAGALHLNVAGSGARIYAVGQFGAADGFELGFRTRWLSARWPLSLLLEVENQRVSDRHSAILDSSRSLRIARYEMDVATREGAPSRLGLLVKYQGVRQEKEWPAQGRHDVTAWFSPYVALDRRDLEWYPSRGALVSARTDVVTGSTFFVRSGCDLRGYFPLREGARPPLLALRFTAATSSSATPSWAHYYHGFNSGLRGYSTERSESAGFQTGGAELRVPLTRETTYNLRWLGRYGRRLPWGVSGVLSVERGELLLDGRRLERLGFAAGLFLRFPYVEILEISAAADRDGNREYLVNTGVHF